jgi:hypothetical protein
VKKKQSFMIYNELITVKKIVTLENA